MHKPPKIKTAMINMLKGVFTNKQNRQAIYIAEIGLNHNGDFNAAISMIHAAANAGANAVKLQTITPELLNSVYTKSLLAGEPLQADTEAIDFFRKFIFSPEEYGKLKAAAENDGMVFFSSPFDAKALSLLEDVNVPLYKIASSEVTNLRLVKQIAATGKPALMSTGISSQQEIAAAINTFKAAGGGELVLFHCVSAYPTESEAANLMRIPALAAAFGLPVGLSDHSVSGKAFVPAAVLGARIFERHFMLDENFDCPDKAVSSAPEEFSRLIKETEEALLMIGDGAIDYGAAEEAAARAARRSLFAAVDIEAGQVVTEDDIVALRPGCGISASEYDKICGLVANAHISKGSLLDMKMFDKVKR